MGSLVVGSTNIINWLNNKLSKNVLGADFVISGNRGNVISTIQNNQANGLGLATLNLTSVDQTSSIVCGASNGLILSTKSSQPVRIRVATDTLNEDSILCEATGSKNIIISKPLISYSGLTCSAIKAYTTSGISVKKSNDTEIAKFNDSG